MTLDDHLRLTIRLNGADAPHDVIYAVLNAAIALNGYRHAKAGLAQRAKPPMHVIQAPIFFGEVYIRRFEAALRDLAAREAFAEGVRSAAEIYSEAFPGVATKPELTITMVSEDGILAWGPYGDVTIPFDEGAIAALERAAIAAVDQPAVLVGVKDAG